jgi:hypothetical protein
LDFQLLALGPPMLSRPGDLVEVFESLTPANMWRRRCVSVR